MIFKFSKSAIAEEFGFGKSRRAETDWDEAKRTSERERWSDGVELEKLRVRSINRKECDREKWKAATEAA